MWGKILKELKYHHWLPIYLLLSVIFVTAGIILFWQNPYLGQTSVFFLLLLAVFIFGIILVVFTHVAHRDGFLDGYHNGRKNGYEDGKKDGQKSRA